MEKLPKDINTELRKVMEPDEKVVDFRKEPWSYYKRNRWVILTTKRLYLIKKIFYGITFDIIEILLASATFEMIEGIIFDTIYVKGSSDKQTVQFFSSHRGETLQFFKEIEKSREGEPEGAVIAKAELEALANIFYEKLITREEYEKKKKELMDKL